jgi:nucleotide-binding universal stress UspA family protein
VETVEPTIDQSRRFGGVARLYGDAAAARFRAAHVVVVGIGGVGSWAAEALARSAVGRITLVDLDHVSESNTNRQIQALGDSYGEAKVTAMARRITAINPACSVCAIDEFASAENAASLVYGADVVLDCADQVVAKAALIAAARAAASGRSPAGRRVGGSTRPALPAPTSRYSPGIRSCESPAQAPARTRVSARQRQAACEIRRSGRVLRRRTAAPAPDVRGASRRGARLRRVRIERHGDGGDGIRRRRAGPGIPFGGSTFVRLTVVNRVGHKRPRLNRDSRRRYVQTHTCTHGWLGAVPESDHRSHQPRADAQGKRGRHDDGRAVLLFELVRVSPETLENYEERMEQAGAERVGQIANAAASAGVPVETVVVKSFSPYEAIIEAAKGNGCDLIVMASHGRRGLNAVLLGSETQKVLTHSAIPVMVYR